jgi:hypothetical protein
MATQSPLPPPISDRDTNLIVTGPKSPVRVLTAAIDSSCRWSDGGQDVGRGVLCTATAPVRELGGQQLVVLVGQLAQAPPARPEAGQFAQPLEGVDGLDDQVLAVALPDRTRSPRRP